MNLSFKGISTEQLQLENNKLRRSDSGEALKNMDWEERSSYPFGGCFLFCGGNGISLWIKTKFCEAKYDS